MNKYSESCRRCLQIEYVRLEPTQDTQHTLSADQMEMQNSRPFYNYFKGDLWCRQNILNALLETSEILEKGFLLRTLSPFDKAMGEQGKQSNIHENTSTINGTGDPVTYFALEPRIYIT